MLQQRQEWVGRTLAATYLIERRLSTGGMGTVFLARHLRTGGPCAVKLLHLDPSEHEAHRRFKEEARIISGLRHPNIVQIIDFDEDSDGHPFIVLEYLEGQDLHQRLQQQGRLPLREVLHLSRQVCAALQAAHDRGIIHRDIKPQNIFLCRHRTVEGDQDLAKVVDFGVSKTQGGNLTQATTLLGTPQFMAPEAARGHHADIDGRVDQFAVGVILYRALSGQLPFPGPDLVATLYQITHTDPPPLLSLCPDLPRHVAAAVDRALSKRREDRYPSMIEFAQALCQGSQGTPEPLDNRATLHVPILSGQALAIGEAAASSVTGRPAPSAVTPISLSSRLSAEAPAGAAPRSNPSLSRSSPALPLAGPVSVQLPGPSSTLSRANAETGRLLPLRVRGRGALLGGVGLGLGLLIVLGLGYGVRPDAGPAPLAESGRAQTQPLLRPTARPRPMVTWSVTSDPPGAQVLRQPGGSLLGQTPWLRESPSAPGKLDIVVRAPGHAERRLSLDLSSNERHHLTLPLLRRPTALGGSADPVASGAPQDISTE